MRLKVNVDAVVPVFVDADGGDVKLYNIKRESDTKAQIEKAIQRVLIRRGAWESKIRINFE